MYEQLSRLLAGDLDASAEARLRARIATDPALARAWADMAALPALLGGLSLEAPPPALAARLAARMDELEVSGLFDPAGFAAAFDSAAFDTAAFDTDVPVQFDAGFFDSADDTMDLDAETPAAPRHPVRARAASCVPASARAREAFLDDLLATAALHHAPVRSPRAPAAEAGRAPRSPAARRIAFSAVVAMAALAVGVAFGLNAETPGATPDTPAAVAIADGTAVIEGTVDLRAGDVHVRVDGRARVTVEPVYIAVTRHERAAPAAVQATEYVYAGPERVASDATLPVRAQERFVAASSTGSAGTPGAAPPSPTGNNAVQPNAAYLAADTSATPSPANVRVTVELELGSAQVAYNGLSTALNVGETRTFGMGHPTVDGLPSGLQGGQAGTTSEMRDHRDRDRARSIATSLARILSGVGSDPTDPYGGADNGPPRMGTALHDEGRLLAALDSMPNAYLLDLDCSTHPCMAFVEYTGDRSDWADLLGATLAHEYDAGVSMTQADVAGPDGTLVRLLAVAVDDDLTAGVDQAPENKRARTALSDLGHELINL